MTPEERAAFAHELHKKLDSHRDVFPIDKYMFEPQESDRNKVKNVSAATLKLLLDYCEEAWDMDFVSYCAGIFHGRAPQPGECAFDLLPDISTKLSADRLGFGHIYGER